MSGLDVLLAVAGLIVTVLVVAGMILITPRGEVDLFGDATHSQGTELSRADAMSSVPAAARRSETRVGQ
jgi:uncharacterized iron-regulated membrane protein